MHFIKRYLTEIVLIIGIILVYCFTALFNEAYIVRFEYNITEMILKKAAILGIVGLGAALVIIAGGIDLSSGSMIALSASLCCLVILVCCNVYWAVDPNSSERLLRILGDQSLVDRVTEDPTAIVPYWMIGVAILVTLLVTLLVGSLHAWLITVIRLPPFVATLASLVGLRSLAIIMNKAVSNELGNESVKLNIQDEAFRVMAAEWWVPVVLFIIIAGFLFVVLNYTVLGRHIYAMGGNEEAAKLSGIRTERLKWFAYCFAAFTAGIAGILMASDTSAADPESNGMMFELFAIAAAVIGGCSLAGGVGRVSGIVLGAIFLRVVIDAVEKLITGGGASNYQGLIVGFLVVMAVAFNEITGSLAGWRKQFFPGALGIVAIVAIGLLVGAVLAFSLQLSDNPNSWVTGLATGIAVAVVLGVVRLLSYLFSRVSTKDVATEK